ncbi:site-specific integrase [Marinifilum sp. D714]|uniref:site-specific integrase n=1 Tax=Marinifilum sp. D714 TaxID=2937523 RepID=UPI0027C75729|nr:site-specific integrase [Marinifilum sp. D714]MDQ2178781.1 site-specific integrase [Marinifilum sp. D714]
MAKVKAVLFTSKKFKDDTFPVMLRITHNRKVKYVSMKISVPKSHWNMKESILVTEVKSKGRLYKRKNLEIQSEIVKYSEVIMNLDSTGKYYTVDDIIAKLKGVDSALFSAFTDNLIQELQKQGRDGNANAYINTKSVFLKKIGKKEISFDEIDYRLLKKFETVLVKEEVSINGISFYMRTIRAIYNRAIKEGVARKENYPFEEYKIKNSKTQKRALTKEDLIKIRDVDLTGKPAQAKARDYFMFSFYCMGMAFVDVAHLKVKNVVKGRLHYSRQKTSQLYNFELVPPAMELISKYSDLKNPEDYIFPIIDPKHPDPYRCYRSRMQVNNYKLKEIQKYLELPLSLTTYVARHSWATIAKRSGIPTAVISEGLGHTTEKTTQIYLDSFENEVLDAANRLITL